MEDKIIQIAVGTEGAIEGSSDNVEGWQTSRLFALTQSGKVYMKWAQIGDPETLLQGKWHEITLPEQEDPT